MYKLCLSMPNKTELKVDEDFQKKYEMDIIVFR